MPDRCIRTILKPAGLLYGAIMSLRNALYDRGTFRSWHSPIPVVSVGNITTGGTGKTPLVDWIVRFYRASGKSAAIVSRGYGRSTRGAQVVSDGNSILLDGRQAGDETTMLARRNPSSIVVVAEKRREGVELILERFSQRLPDVIILDDAFQHRAIRRNLDIVVISADQPFADACMLPAGQLREPLRGLCRADLFLVSKVSDERKAAGLRDALLTWRKPVVLSKVRAGRLLRASRSLPETPATGLPPHAQVLAFAGIGEPESFLRSLAEAGVSVAASKFFRDHHPYTADAVQAIVAEARRLHLVPVTTEKDWSRLRDEQALAGLLEEAGCLWLSIEPELFSGRTILESRLAEIVGKPSGNHKEPRLPDDISPDVRTP